MAKVATPKFDAWVASRWPGTVRKKAVQRRGGSQRAKEAEKRAKTRGAPVESGVEDVSLWFAAQSGCAYCGDPAFGIDHVMPISRGGAHSVENFQPLCRHCNSLKLALTEAELLARIETILPVLRAKLCTTSAPL